MTTSPRAAHQATVSDADVETVRTQLGPWLRSKMIEDPVIGGLTLHMIQPTRLVDTIELNTQDDTEWLLLVNPEFAVQLGEVPLGMVLGHESEHLRHVLQQYLDAQRA